MHYHGPVLAGLCFMYRELAGTVVAELLADAFPVYVVEAVFQYATRVPIAPDSLTLGFVVFCCCQNPSLAILPPMLSG